MRKILSKRLKECRHRLGLSQRQVGLSCGISENTYSKYERMKTLPRPSVLYRIAVLFDVSMDYLIGRTDTPGFDSSQAPHIKELGAVTQEAK